MKLIVPPYDASYFVLISILFCLLLSCDLGGPVAAAGAARAPIIADPSPLPNN